MKVELINIEQYLNHDNRGFYDRLIRYAREFNQSEDCYKIGKLTEKRYGDIKDYQYLMETELTFKDQLEFFGKFHGSDKISKYRLDKVCRTIAYIDKSINDIIEVESKVLTSAPSSVDIEAGLERFEGLGIYMQIRKIAITFSITPQQVKDMNYSECLTELYTSKQIDDYQNDYSNIMNRK